VKPTFSSTRRAHKTACRRCGVDQLEITLRGVLGKEALAATEHDGMKPKLILVNEIELNQVLHEPRTPDHPQRLPRPFFEPRDLGRRVADDRRSPPGCILER
jgi:hypothetical protein